MPIIKVEYDDGKVTRDEIVDLSNAMQEIVSEATEIKEVFVYGNSSDIKIKIDPIEIFIEMSDHKISDEDELFDQIKSGLSKWKSDNDFNYPINLTLIPMHWKLEIGI